MIKPTRVNWDDLETAFERNVHRLRSYVERSTGSVLALIEDFPEDEAKLSRIRANPDEYVLVEPASPKEQYRWMEQFVGSLPVSELRDRLQLAIDGKGAFRRFKDVILNYPAERERWFRFRSEWLRYHINRWVEKESLTPEPPAPWGDVSAPELVATIHGAEKSEDKGSEDGPAETVRKQLKTLIDTLPPGELYSARVFLEYLKEKGSADLNRRGTIDFRRPFRRRSLEEENEAAIPLEKLKEALP